MQTEILIQINRNLRKKKELQLFLYHATMTSHTIAHLMLFTHAFCNTHVENLLKGPAGRGISSYNKSFPLTFGRLNMFEGRDNLSSVPLTPF